MKKNEEVRNPLGEEAPNSFLDRHGKTIGYIAAGAFILLGIAYGLIYLNIAQTATEPYWSRFIGLLPVIEALIFASAGFIFGKEVHREQAEKADKRAEKEGNRANIAEANGKVLKNSITDFARRYASQRMESYFQTWTVLDANQQSHVSPIKTEMETDLQNLVDKANDYFPDQETV